MTRLRPATSTPRALTITPESVPERASVQAVGGRVVIAGDPKTHATRDLIALIRERFR